MNTALDSTRRRFFCKAGAILSTPLVMAAAQGLAAEDTADLSGSGRQSLEARLRELEDANSIRDLHARYAELVNARAQHEAARLFVDPGAAGLDRGISSVSADSLGDRDVIELSPDGLTASAAIHCTVETSTPIGPDCTLVEMARLQGDGMLRRRERCVLETTCIKRGRDWLIERARYRIA